MSSQPDMSQHCDCGHAHPAAEIGHSAECAVWVAAWAKLMKQMDSRPEARTTKKVTGTFELTFHGDYLSADEVFTHFEGWVDSGLDDRDDLRSWNFTLTSLEEVQGDPEGFDA